MATIILAEDDELVGEYISEILMKAGYPVGWCKDGEHAIQVMKARTPDLAILDQRMPGMNGVSVIQKMRQDENLFRVPIVMLTAVSNETDKDIAYYYGADVYITKPFDPDYLLARIGFLLSAKTPISLKNVMD